MAKTKAAGKTSQQPPRPGKRLGLKITQGEEVKPGAILIRQRGNKIHPGKNVGQGRDFTLFALKKGTVNFRQKLGKKIIQIND